MKMKYFLKINTQKQIPAYKLLTNTARNPVEQKQTRKHELKLNASTTFYLLNGLASSNYL